MGNIWEFFFYTGKHILVNEMIAFKDLDLRKTRENQITEKYSRKIKTKTNLILT